MPSSTMPPSRRGHCPPDRSRERMCSASPLPTRQKLLHGRLETTLQGKQSSSLSTHTLEPLQLNSSLKLPRQPHEQIDEGGVHSSFLVLEG